MESSHWSGSHSEPRDFVTVFYSYANSIDAAAANADGDAVNTVTLIDVIFWLHISMIIYLTLEHFNSKSLVLFYKNFENDERERKHSLNVEMCVCLCKMQKRRP